jgi:hypothetical protein
MPDVLTTGHTVQCSHGGKVTPVASPKLTVGGEKVVTAAGLLAGTVAGCTTPATTTTKPCTKVSPPIGGQTAKLTVAGVPVALTSATGATDGVPPASLQVTAATRKLRA